MNPTPQPIDEGKKLTYEQLEYQRNNPHLFTTMTQSVNADGTIVSYEQVTRKLRDTLDKMQAIHSKKFGGIHPVYCMRPVMGTAQNAFCESIEMVEKDLDRCMEGFVRNYKYMQERTRDDQL